MLKAAQLTRAGQLMEATEIIQRMLRPGEGAGPATPGTSGGTEGLIEGDFYVMDAEDSGAAPSEPQPRPPPEWKANFHGGPAWTSMDLEALNGQWRGFKGPMGAPRPARTPDPLSDGARFITGSYANPAGARHYKLYVPSSYAGQSLPLIVMLHGCTQDPDDFAAGTRMNELAEKEPCLVLYPAQAQTANGSKCWNWFKPTDQARDQGEPSIIAGMTRQVGDTFSVDPDRIYIAGLSAGGAMAVTLGILYPDLYAAVGIHSGLPHGAACDLQSALAVMQNGGASPLGRQRQKPTGTLPFPTIVFHGDRDTTVHPCNSDQVIRQCAEPASARPAQFGADPQVNVHRGQVPNGHAYTRTIHQRPGRRPIAEHWLIHGAGHAWSGGDSRGSYTDPKGPDASGQMLRFFLEHPKGESSA